MEKIQAQIKMIMEMIMKMKTRMKTKYLKGIFIVTGIIVMGKFKEEIGVINMTINVNSVEERFAGTNNRKKSKNKRKKKTLKDGIVTGVSVMVFLKEEHGAMH